MNSEFNGGESCTLIFERNGESTTLCGRICAYEGGFKIEYLAEGDGCTVVYDGEKLVQSRRGQVNFDMTFSQNAPSFLVFGEAGACGKLKIITNALKVTDDGNKKIIQLIYVLGEGGEKVNLKITASKDKEKK